MIGEGTAMELELRGRSALVTGAAGGIGRGVARTLTAEGMRLALLDRDQPGLRRTDEELSPGAALLVADVTDEEQVAAAVAIARERLGGLDTVVCCAGISGPVGSGIEGIARAEWDAVFAVNVTGAFLVLKHALPALREADRASVVLVASDSAVVASPGMAPYCASKAALVQFGRALSVDLAPSGIRVTTVSPSIVDTPMSRADLGIEDFEGTGFEGAGFEGVGSGAAGFEGVGYPVQTADEVAAHVAYLASPRTRAVNGTGILSDFGYSARSGFPA
ncbi:dihydroanticapsin dehydrogenase [Microbacterium resistens]|uniref:Dihydroanticapsin dehydrogenase n=1 Tax=Microbacterium resistens TaxID=156977 RepID=A0ABU1S9B5_9MICO|nr:SDR family oxidoreductase [Microbacterium resistens]MDR6866207.1 dihydroanticapsin dehydrogenase [Microbacterium resistens]